jgi:alginate O-acetyltransferase complex protein AlgI
MLFNSVDFLIFFPVVTALYFILEHKFRWILLLLASCYFYMSFVPEYIIILFVTIGIDYAAGILIDQNQGRRRKSFLIASIVANVGILCVFKYYNFFIGSFNDILPEQSAMRLPLLQILLPIGLSFHTFQSMSYTIEVYRGHTKPEMNLGIFSLYVLFYPQLVAGPIERPQNLLNQFHTRKYFDVERVKSGLWLMLVGFFKKVVIADRLASFVNIVYNDPQSYSGLPVIVAIFFFAIQIYCDFSGYTDIARGAARIMGFELMVNFKQPYFAKSLSEFWSRWHISLSTWFRDYLYIPLGGNKFGKFKTMRNLFLVFLISGLWHGASWTFIVWGAMHGIYSVVERSWMKSNYYVAHFKEKKFAIVSGWVLTMIFVCIAWIFFRATSFTNAKEICLSAWKGILNLNNYAIQFRGIGWKPSDLLLSLVLIILLFIFDFFSLKKNVFVRIRSLPLPVRWAFYYAILFLILFYSSTDSAQNFIYFQF